MTDDAPGASGQTGGSPEPGGKGSGDSPEPGGQGSGADKTTYTQGQVDAFIAEERRRTAARFGDYDATKARLAELEAAGQTELERAQTQAKDAEARASAAAAQRDALTVRSALTAAAARAGALDPDIVVALLASDLTVSESGEVNGNVEALVTKLLEEKPYLKNGGGPARIGSADQGAHSGGRPASSTPSQAMDDLMRAQR